MQGSFFGPSIQIDGPGVYVSPVENTGLLIKLDFKKMISPNWRLREFSESYLTLSIYNERVGIKGSCETCLHYENNIIIFI